jgi:hypothetical protein
MEWELWYWWLNIGVENEICQCVDVPLYQRRVDMKCVCAFTFAQRTRNNTFSEVPALFIGLEDNL